MENKMTETTFNSRKARLMRTWGKRCMALVLAMALVFTSTTPVEAFSFKKLFKGISKAVNEIVEIANPPASKTVYNYQELNSYIGSIFGPSTMTATLGSDITVPSNGIVVSSIRDVVVKLNGKTVYVDNPRYGFFCGFGHKLTIEGPGTIVQRVNNSEGVIHINAGDLWVNNVTIKKSLNVTKATGLSANAAIASPEATLSNVTFNGLTTGMMVENGAKVIANNCHFKNLKGDGICLPDNVFDKKSTLRLSNSDISYFTGNGVFAGYNTRATLENVTITGGTNRNRYGILAGQAWNSDWRVAVELKGNSKVYNNAGGNIGVYRAQICLDPIADYVPITIDSLDSNDDYSFTVVDGLDGSSPATVAQVTNGIANGIRSYNVGSDISRYMVLNQGNKIMIQNPPEQCEVDVVTEWIGTGKALDTSKDSDFATAALGDDTTSAIVKYDTSMTLATVNNNPDRYEFLGWKRYTHKKDENGNIISTTADSSYFSTDYICQVDVIDEFVTYKAEYQYKQYTVTIVKNGNGSVAGGGTYWVDDVVTLSATADAPVYKDGVLDKAYGFSRWNDAGENTTEQSSSVTDANGTAIPYIASATRNIVVTANETYVASFKKISQTSGKMYRGLQEISGGQAVPEGNLLLVYVGEGFEGNRMETGGSISGAAFGVTGLPEGSAMMAIATSAQAQNQKPYNDNNANFTFTPGKANYYAYQEYKDRNLGTLPGATTGNTTCVYWTQKAADFDNCNPGFIRWDDNLGCWLYWCCGGAVEAAGPYILYSYTDEVEFSMNSVSVKMNPEFRPGAEGDTISAPAIIATAKDAEGNEYILGGLKFGDSNVGLDNSIDYAQGDKSIAMDLDGITYDYDFPEAIIGEEQYTDLEEALAAVAASGNAEVIEIVGPGVDKIEGPIDLANGDQIKGYGGEIATAMTDSKIGVDKDGTVRVQDGTLHLTPAEGGSSIGVKNGEKEATVTADKPVQVTANMSGSAIVVPDLDDTTLTISPDNHSDHKVVIEGAQVKEYEFDNIPMYSDEKVTVSPGTEFTVNVPADDGTTIPITVGKNNTGATIIETVPGTDNPKVTLNGSNDRMTVGDKTYKSGDSEQTVVYVDPNPNAVPSVVLEAGEIGIPVESTIQVGGTTIENIGSSDGVTTGTSNVTVDANGSIDIPDGGGIQIGNTQIQVPKKTPLNGNTVVELDENGKPVINTSGGSEVKLVVDGNETIYQVGDYDATISIGSDGIPVIEDGEIVLQPGQVVKDRLGNEYMCPEDAQAPITIMTTPQVYNEGELVGGGNMSFVIPQNQSIACKPAGSSNYTEFENPGNDEGFFNLKPENAAAGLQADSELGLAVGKTISLNTGDGNVQVTTVSGEVLVDGSTGTITLKDGAVVTIDGKIYKGKAGEDTVLLVDGNGVHLSDGGVIENSNAPIIVDGLEISSDNKTISVTAGEPTAEGYSNAEITVAGGGTFTTKPVGSDDAGITYKATGSGTKTYEVAPDGTLYLPAGESIIRKEGNKEVTITAPVDAPLMLSPMIKPSAQEIEDAEGEILPLGGVQISVPEGKSVQIGENTYSEGVADEVNAGNLQLVLDEAGDVVLYGGTVALEKNAVIQLYDVNNEKTIFKNVSENAATEILVSNPGVVTMPTVGATIQMSSGNESVEYTGTEENTQLIYTSDISILKTGGVALDASEKILLGGVIVTNTGASEMKVSAQETGNDTDGYITTGTITIPNDGSFSLSADLESKTAVIYSSNDENAEGETTFAYTEDGSLAVPDGAIMDIVTGNKSVELQAYGAEDEQVETMPTEDGVMMAIPVGGYVLVDGVKYENNGTDILVLSVDKDGKVILLQGEVKLSEGAVIYVNSSDGTLVPVENQSSDGESEVIVGFEGVEYDENGEMTSEYPEVSIQASAKSSIAVGGNEYEISQDCVNGASISMNIGPVEGNVIEGGSISGDRILLEDGTVDMGAGSSITVKNPYNAEQKNVLTNDGGDTDAPITVGSDASIILPEGAALTIESGENATTIELPAGGSGEEYFVAVDLGNSNGDIDIALQPGAEAAEGTTTGSGNRVIINGGTYESNEADKNLSLTLTPSGEELGKITLAGNSTSVNVSDGASVTVGDTTVTATGETPICVTETTQNGKDVPEVNIPAGGEANFNNPNANQNINVKVPESAGSDAEQQFSVDSQGNIITNLEQGETVVIGGVEYTGTANGDIKVDGETGVLLESPEEGKPSISIEASEFTNPNFKVVINPGESITVDGVIYQASSDSTITLYGNPNGSPYIELAEGASVTIGDESYTAAEADTKFAVQTDGKVTLVSGALQLGGKSSYNVNGVTYKGGSEADSYKVAVSAGQTQLTITDGSKVQTDMPKDTTIYVQEAVEVEIVNVAGEKEIKTITSNLPITMSGSSGTVYFDKSQEGKTGTVVLQTTGIKEVKLQYNGSGVMTGLTIENRKSSGSSSGGSDLPGNITEGNISIAVTNGSNSGNVDIPIVVEGSKIIIDTITSEQVKELLQQKEEDKENNKNDKEESSEKKKVVVIDCSAVEDKTVVVLDIPTVKILADHTDEIKIKTSGADISIDKKATKALIEQAEGNTIEIKVNVEETSILNEVQEQVLIDYNVETCLEAYAESNGVRIHDFKGGKIKVGIPWTVAADKDEFYYHVYYLSDDGVMTLFETVYENGMLCFETDHFSEYVIVYDLEFKNATKENLSTEASGTSQSADQMLLAVATKANKTSIQIKWNKVSGAEKYVIYAAKCNSGGKVYELKKVATVESSKQSYKLKGLEKGTNYKIRVLAIADGEELKRSVALHVTTKGGKRNNASDIEILQKEIVLKAGKKKTLKVQYESDKNSLNHGGIVRFKSTNKKIATVNKKGMITAKKAGICYVYVFLNSGEYAVIKVTVR